MWNVTVNEDRIAMWGFHGGLQFWKDEEWSLEIEFKENGRENFIIGL